jgi:hypothetical protein
MGKSKKVRKMLAAQMAPAERVRRAVGERERTRQGTATVQRILKVGEDGLEVTTTGVQRLNQAPLDRLWHAGVIIRREFDAGDKLRALAYLAAIDPAAGSVNWSAAGGGGRSAKVPSMFTNQDIADARVDFRRIEKAISGIVWRVLYLALIKEIGLADVGESVFARHDAREARAAGTAGFQTALGAAADYFGM